MSTNSQTFYANGGSLQTWTVPTLIVGDIVQMTLVGACGGPGQGSNHPGGRGGMVTCGGSAPAGDVFNVYVGLQGGSVTGITQAGWGIDLGGSGGSGAGAVSYGGGGGGASGVQDSTANVILAVAGGGGGGGSGYNPGVYGEEPPHYDTGQGGYGGHNPQAGFPGGGNHQYVGGTVGSGSTTGGTGAGGDAHDGSGGGGGGGDDGSNSAGGGGGGGSGTAGTQAAESNANLGSAGGGMGGCSSVIAGVGNVNYYEGSVLSGLPYPVDANGNTTYAGQVTIAWNEADPSLAPTPLTPISLATLDTTVSNAFTWQYNAQEDSGNQYAYALRIQNFGGGWLYWNGTDFSNTTLQWNISSTPSATITANKIAPNGPYVWEVATLANQIHETGVTLIASYYPWSQSQVFITTAAPTVQIITPQGQTGIIPPTITWIEQLTAGGSQTYWRALIYQLADTEVSGFYPPVQGSGVGRLNGTPSGAPEYDSGEVAGAARTSGVVTGSYVTGQSYAVYVAIVQTNGAVSGWATTVLRANATTPATPGICVLDLGSGGTAVEIVVWGNDDNDLPGQCTVEIDYSSDSGGTWSMTGTQAATMEMPGQMYGTQQTVAYTSASRWRARVTSPVPAASPWVVFNGVVESVSGAPTLADPNISSTQISLWIKATSARERHIDQLVAQGIGNPEEIVISDVRRLRSGELQLWSQGNYHRDALIALCTPPRPLTWTRPANDPNYPAETLVIIPTGDITEDKPGELWAVVPRHLTIHYTEQI